jgi:hypothetical protein
MDWWLADLVRSDYGTVWSGVKMERQTFTREAQLADPDWDKLIDQFVDKLLQPEAEKPHGGLQAYLDQHNFAAKRGDSSRPISNQNEWTVFVNLSGNHAVNNAGLRIDKDLQDEQFIASTKGKPIKIIVQVAVNNDPERNGTSPPFKKKDIDEIVSPALSEISVVRYEISNGEKHLLSSGPSSGAVADLRDLMTGDPAALQAKHVMLMNEAHGEAMLGLHGDTGSMSTKALTSVINDAMAKSGRRTVDVLDLLSCEMSNLQALGELAKGGKFIVASEFPEFSLPVGDNLQPVAQPLAKLIQHLESEPIDAAKTIEQVNTEVCTANATDRFKKDLNKDYYPCGAVTLGVYDGSAIPVLNESLNRLGKVLVDAGQDYLTKARIAFLASTLPPVFSSPKLADRQRTMSDEQHRDLGMFLDGLDSAISRKAAKDTMDGTIVNAIRNVRQAMNKVIVQHFNSSELGMRLPESLRVQRLPVKPVSGISVLLPSSVSDYAAVHAWGATLSIKSNVETFERKFENAYYDKKEWNAAKLRDDLDKETKPLSDHMSEFRTQQAQQFAQTAAHLQDWLGTNDARPPDQKLADYYELKRQYNIDLDALMKDPQVVEILGAPARQYSANILKENALPTLSDWNKFTDMLANQ